MQRCGDAGMQGGREAGRQGCSDAGTQGGGDAGTRGRGDVGMQGGREAALSPRRDSRRSLIPETTGHLRLDSVSSVPLLRPLIKRTKTGCEGECGGTDGVEPTPVSFSASASTLLTDEKEKDQVFSQLCNKKCVCACVSVCACVCVCVCMCVYT